MTVECFNELLSETGGPSRACRYLPLRLELGGGAMEARVAVPAGELGLADAVPLARRISQAVVSRILHDSRSNGQAAACRKGCAACCRYLVPLSVPEALELWQHIQSQPPSQRSRTEQGLLAAAGRIVQAGPPAWQADGGDNADAPPGRRAIRCVSRWYADLHLDCPFLARQNCTIYSHRPIACQEHLVAGDTGHCGLQHGQSQPLALPISMTHILSRLAAELEGRPEEALLLPMLQPWMQDNLPRLGRRWPAEKVAGKLVSIVESALAAAPAASVA